MIATSHATAQYLKSIGFDKTAYVIGNKVLVAELEAVGIKTIGSGPDVCDTPLAEHVFKAAKSFDKEVGAVVVAFDEHFGFPKLFKAVNYLRNPAVKFIATNDDEKVDFPHFTFPDAGAIIAAIENVTQRKVEVVGKPSRLLTEIALKHEMHRESGRILMMGDRLNTDILFGKRNNFQTLLVGTGVHKMKDVEEALEKLKKGEGGADAEQMIPDYYVSALKNLFK
jgi:phosphoglycolate phosphatase